MAIVDNAPAVGSSSGGWGTLRLLSKYQWFVFFVVTTAWVADCMDQQLFNLARSAAVAELTAGTDYDVKKWPGYSTSIFLIGWAIGGLFFGAMGDKVGRVKTLMTTVLLYSAFTGLSSLSIGIWDFCLYRFLTGLGVGGVFAVAVSLLAETMPAPARPYTLGLLQAFSAVGNCTAACVYILLGNLELDGSLESLKPLTAWRMMFLVGLAPAILVLIMRGRIKEPEAWVRAKAIKDAEHAARGGGAVQGKYAELFADPKYRRHAIMGLILAFSGVVGLWGVGFFSIDLAQNVLRTSFQNELAGTMEPAAVDAAVKAKMKIWAGYSSLLLNIGAFFGMFAFSWVTQYIGRKITFAFFFVAAGLATLLLFLKLEDRSQVFWMYPMLGFFQLAIFGGYAIYFPELFPTRLRSTGTSFCYNVGRLVAAIGPFMLGVLTAQVFSKDKGYVDPEPYRYAGAVMCSVFLVGLIALPFLPETKDKPLPE